MALAENLTIGEHIVSSVIHMQEVANSIDYLNVKKQSWYMPWDSDKEINHSFGEMYNQAVAEGTKLIKRNYLFLSGKITKRALLKDIGNKSLSSGLDINEDKTFYVHGRTQTG